MGRMEEITMDGAVRTERAESFQEGVVRVPAVKRVHTHEGDAHKQHGRDKRALGSVQVVPVATGRDAGAGILQQEVLSGARCKSCDGACPSLGSKSEWLL